MIKFIASIVEKFGGRVAGSKEEREAQLYFKGLLEGYCDSVQLHEFKSALNAKFRSLKGFCIVYLLALAQFHFNVIVATFYASINAFLFIGHFIMNRSWLDFLYKKHNSCNVIGVIEPKQKATSTIIVSGHMDSVYEFKWWHRFGQWGVFLTILSGILIVMQAAFYLFSSFIYIGFQYLPLIFRLTWLIFIILSPCLVAFYSIHGKVKVDGAIDNLTGVALALEMSKVFSGLNKLEHTRLKIISFGSEETGLKGSKKYVKDHLKELRNEHAIVLNVDTIKNKEMLTILTKEYNSRVTYSKNMVNRMENAFNENKVNFQKINLPIGSTDGASFAKYKIPTCSMIGMSTIEFEPAYHTRLDCLENLDPAGIEALREILISFITKWDSEQPKL